MASGLSRSTFPINHSHTLLMDFDISSIHSRQMFGLIPLLPTSFFILAAISIIIIYIQYTIMDGSNNDSGSIFLAVIILLTFILLFYRKADVTKFGDPLRTTECDFQQITHYFV